MIRGRWTTTTAASALYNITAVPLVTEDFVQYKSAFLYALAMVWEVELGNLSLTDRASEAAFNLVQAHQSWSPERLAHAPVGFCT